jgi:hypothetical protein
VSLDIIPCEILPGISSARSRAWEMTPVGGRASGLEKFAALASFQRERRINWPRSFSLKGLPYGPYRYQGLFGSNRFQWILAAGEDPSLPRAIVFLRSGDSEAVRQGEVLTYVTDRKVVHVEEGASLLLADDVEPDFFARFPEDEWVSGASRLDELVAFLLPEKRAAFQAAVVSRWIDGRSAVRIAY